MKAPHPPAPRFSNRWPNHDLETPEAIDFEERVESVRQKFGENAHIEIKNVEHAPECKTHDARRCTCSPEITVIVAGEWLRIHPDGTTEPAPPPAPHPDWLDAPDGSKRLAEVLPSKLWVRCMAFEHACAVIGDGLDARFLNGSPINEELTRRLRRCEAAQ